MYIYGMDSGSFKVIIQGSGQGAPTIWDMISLPWLIFIFIIAFGIAFAYHRKKSGYVVSEAFLIHKAGLPLAHVSPNLSSALDDVVVSGMLTAVLSFINDAFSDNKLDDDWELYEMKFGENKIIIERSPNFYFAVIFKGNGSKLHKRVKKLLLNIDEKYGSALDSWDGDMDELKGIEPIVAQLISKKSEAKITISS